MTTDRPPSAAELRSCAPWERNCATSAPEPATTYATTAQPGSLKAAAALLLQRNQARNTCATEAAQPRNFEPATEPPKVARAAGFVMLIEEPTTHCSACGSPSWWLCTTARRWRCSYCEPRPASFTGPSLVLADGQWAPGCASPARPAVTAADVLARHGELLLAGTVRTLDLLEHAAPDDLADLLNPDMLDAFARALVADRRVKSLPDPALPPLARITAEIGDAPGELAEYLNHTGTGRALRARLEREPGAADRCLLALRADPVGGLLVTLLRALDGDRIPHRHDDGRVQGHGGAWRTPAAHEAIRAYDAHHWTCDRCRRAGCGYGSRCAEGARLQAAYAQAARADSDTSRRWPA